ncbi:DUF72 domain-containing protein [Actinomycetaceae bacterium MB13-C1-2]|nr:DUF72 domain-containing protein [Actinomycetaceae bacterium MB13-C1-2]
MNEMASKPKGLARIGTSGWKYPEWRGKFYPKGLVQRLELSYFAQRIHSLELNGPFYGLMRPSTYQNWASEVPDGFRYAVKGWKTVSHLRRLRDVEKPLSDFFASGLLELGDKLGPVLWQLPPSLRFDAPTLNDFLKQLPATTAEAAGIAGVSAPDRSVQLRYALEPRNQTFSDPEAVAILKEHDVAMVTSDNPDRFPIFHEVTASFAYFRLHGTPKMYYSDYSDEQLAVWAGAMTRLLQEGRDVYCYFDNTAGGRAPYNAMSLAEVLRGEMPAQETLPEM